MAFPIDGRCTSEELLFFFSGSTLAPRSLVGSFEHSSKLSLAIRVLSTRYRFALRAWDNQSMFAARYQSVFVPFTFECLVFCVSLQGGARRVASEVSFHSVVCGKSYLHRKELRRGISWDRVQRED